jgi:hypothetical protein
VICSSGEGKFDAYLARLLIIAGYPTVKETKLIVITLTDFFLLKLTKYKKMFRNII